MFLHTSHCNCTDGSHSSSALTFSLNENPEQRIGCRNCLVIIVIIIDGQQVSVNVRVPHQDIDVGDLVHVLQ